MAGAEKKAHGVGLARARRAHAAAALVLAEADGAATAVPEAVPLLAMAIRHLARAEGSVEDPSQLSLPGLEPEERDRLLALMPRILAAAGDVTATGEEKGLPDRDALEDAAALLGAVLAASQPASLRDRATRMVAIALALGVAGLLLAAVGRDDVGWQGRYYQQPDLSGSSIVRRDPRVEFQWNNGPPLPDLPEDDFSVRWDTCLQLGRQQTLEAFLGSNDGIRLYVDGELFVDSWFDRSFTSQSYALTLDAGSHHLAVEYYDRAGEAGVVARFLEPGLRPVPLPPERFRLPTGDPDGPEACN